MVLNSKTSAGNRALNSAPVEANGRASERIREDYERGELIITSIMVQHPTLWKRCNITPVPKSAMKDPHLPINYRGISLLSCVGKMYSSLLSNRILSYCELCNILVDEQNGFRKNRSCNDHIFSLSCIIRNRLNKGKPTFAAFLDMEKAFDKVDRNLLLLRLLQYGIDDKMYYSIKNMYVDNIARVKVNNLFTDWLNVSSGVRQGDNLSPVLFIFT